MDLNNRKMTNHPPSPDGLKRNTSYGVGFVSSKAPSAEVKDMIKPTNTG